MSKFKPVNCRSLTDFDVPEEWIENAVRVQERKKPAALRPHIISTAASVAVIAAVLLTLLSYSGGNAPLTQPPPLPKNVRETSMVPSGTADTPRMTTGGTFPTFSELSDSPLAESAAEASHFQPIAPGVSSHTEPSAQSPAPGDTEPTEQASAPDVTEPESPSFVPVTDPIEETRFPPDVAGDPNATSVFEITPQPPYEDDVYVVIKPGHMFYDTDEVFLHIINERTGEPLYPMYTEAEKLDLTAGENGERNAVVYTDNRMEKFSFYTFIFYDRSGRSEWYRKRVIRHWIFKLSLEDWSWSK